MASYSSSPKIKKPDQNMAFSAVLIKLLQGFIVSDEKKILGSHYWTYQEAVREYFFYIGSSATFGVWTMATLF